MKPTDLSLHVTNYLTRYLAGQRNLSPNTIKAQLQTALDRLRLNLVDPIDASLPEARHA